jgi:hypothetical protein
LSFQAGLGGWPSRGAAAPALGCSAVRPFPSGAGTVCARLSDRVCCFLRWCICAGLPHPSTTADVVRFGGGAGATLAPSLAHLPDMPYPHADDVNDGAEVLGLTFFAGGGGAVSVWNSSENKWLPNTWTIAPRKFLACASATAAGGTKGYVMCGGGEGAKKHWALRRFLRENRSFAKTGSGQTQGSIDFNRFVPYR